MGRHAYTWARIGKLPGDPAGPGEIGNINLPQRGIGLGPAATLVPNY
jgi:hypothetical protein